MARMNKRVVWYLAKLLCLVSLFSAEGTEETSKLHGLRATYEAEKVKLAKKYVRALKKAETAAMKRNDLDAAIAFRDERLKVSRPEAIAESTSSLGTRENQPPTEPQGTVGKTKLLDIPPGQSSINISYEALKPKKSHTFWATRNIEKDGTLRLSIMTPSGKVHEIGRIPGDAFPVSQSSPKRYVFPMQREHQTEKGKYHLYIYNEGQATVSIWKLGE